MTRTLAFLAIVASASAGLFDISSKASTVHKEFDFVMGINKFPRTRAEARKLGYKEVQGPKMSSDYDTLNMYGIASDNYLITLYFDENEQVAGLCVNLPKDKVTSYFDMAEQGFTSWSYDSVDYWRTSIFFVSEDKQTRINSADPSKLIRHDYLTVQGWNGTLDKIHIIEKDIVADANWVKEACIPMMGQHYYYKMTPDLSCNQPFYPWFLVTKPDTNQMVGVGLMNFGTIKRDTENADLDAVKMSVPTAPECMYDLVATKGAFIIHINLIDQPRPITC